MDMTGEQRIPASRETVWKALNDPEILKASIPGCQELVKQSNTDMTAVAVIKVGPISARFQGKVTLSDLDPPNGYRITGEGQGGVAGHARGGAVVRLTEDGGETILHYEVSAQVGGRLAQLGSRMIDATARSMSAAFFRKFAQEILAREAGPTAVAAKPVATMESAPAARLPDSVGPVERRYTSGLTLIWTVAGFLLGLLTMGVVSAPLMTGTGMSGTTGSMLCIVAVGLALLQGYLLGRQGLGGLNQR